MEPYYPVREPADAEVAKRISTLASYVCRNGLDFEKVVRQKESGNPNFDFLNDGEYSAYYKWTLYCIASGFNLDEVNEVLDCICILVS